MTTYTIMSSAAVSQPLPAGWLRSAGFDHFFITGIAAFALLSAAVVVARPELFQLILFADLWLLGYHHVIATFTRLAFDRESLREHRFFVFYLPFIVIGATFALALSVGVWVIATVYLYWQWFHYTRQSWGISQVYRGKSQGLVDDSAVFSKLCFYLVPAWGILHRSWQAPDKFLFIELRVIPTPGWLVDVLGAAALLSVLTWSFTRIRAWRAGRLSHAHTAYMLSHFAVFFVGYRLIEDITYGWLAINIWHNAQYLLFVWLFNNNRFKNGVDERARFLSTISQPTHVVRYFVACMGITTLIYGFSLVLTREQLVAGVPLSIVLYQGVNFHHYIVDSKIWKVRKKRMQTTLGLNPH
ncbi:MAG: hypothetical protein IH885_00620 [Myxococcales bacterium]|nr:hypothetical protein [Myxococcales bacterium]